MYLDFLGMHLNGKKAEGKNITITLNLLDTQQQYALELENSVLIYTPHKKLSNANANVDISLNRNTFDALTLGKLSLDEGIKNGSIHIQGNKNKIIELFSLMDTFNPSFNIMTSNINYADVPST